MELVSLFSGQVLWECDFLDWFTDINDFPCNITNAGDSMFILNEGRTNRNSYERARFDPTLQGNTQQCCSLYLSHLMLLIAT